MDKIKNIIKQASYLIVLVVVASISKVAVSALFERSNTKFSNNTIERVWGVQDLLGLKIDLPTKLVEGTNDANFPPEVQEVLVSYKEYKGQSKNTFIQFSKFSFKEGIEYDSQTGARGAIYNGLATINKDEPIIHDEKFSNGIVSGVIAKGQKLVKGKNIYAKAFVFKQNGAAYMIMAVSMGEDFSNDEFLRMSQSVSAL